MKLFRERKRIVRTALALLALAVLAAVCLLVCLSLRGKLRSQTAAERFAGDAEPGFAQLSVFMSEKDALSLNDVYTFRQALLDGLADAGIDAEGYGRVYLDAWSAFGTLNVAGERGNADVEVVAVGGDWFFFHPLRLKSGGYLWEDDVMDDLVVLDRDLAWRLYGGDDLTGLTLTIGGKPFLIAGVVERDGDFASRAAREEEQSLLYMSYSAFNALTPDALESIDCYELVAPQPVKRFAEGFVKEKFPIGGGDLVINSERFSLSGVWAVVREFGTRSMHRSSVIYPEWENAARCLGDWCALFLALAVCFAAAPTLGLLIAFLAALVRAKDILQKRIPGLVSDAVDRSRTRRWEKRTER